MVSSAVAQAILNQPTPDILGQFRQGQEYQRGQSIRNFAGQAARGDSDAMRELESLDPMIALSLQQSLGARDQASVARAIEDARIAKGLIESGRPQDARTFISNRVRALKGMGANADQTQNVLDVFDNEGPDAAYKALQGFTNALDQAKDVGKIGTYNPRDYTTESWGKFLGSGDPTKLERYESQSVVDVGGAKYLVDRVTGARTPVSTTEEEAGGRASIASAVQKAKEEAKNAAAKDVASAVGSAKLADAQAAYNALSSADLDIIYGKGESWYPEFFRSQKGIDLIAQRDKLMGMLELGARGELKGQGTITDNEADTLRKAASALANPNISPELARDELEAAMNVLRRNAGVSEEPRGGGKDLDINALVNKYRSK